MSAIHHRWKILLALPAVVVFALAVAACGDDRASSAEESAAGDAAFKADQLILATTTSLKDSGLLDELVLPAFNEAHPDVTVKTIAVGSGEAMQMGRDGEADVLLVHSPADEEAFMEEGNGTIRLPVAQNYFVIVGPADDPAKVAAADAAEAFAAIPDSGTPFISRGDDSGTHKKELSIWEEAGVTPEGDWYVSTGQGMGETLQVASERQGYTLTDLGTFLSMQDTLDLKVLSEESEDLRNIYSVIVVNQIMHPKTNAAGAEMFARILITSDMQNQIGDFGTEEFGQPLFAPNASALGGPDY